MRYTCDEINTISQNYHHFFSANVSQTYLRNLQKSDATIPALIEIKAKLGLSGFSKGSFGKVYKSNGAVFKYFFPRRFLDKSSISEHVKQVADAWNYYFECIGMPELAIAKACKSSLSNEWVLVTPFLSGRELDYQNESDAILIKRACNEMSEKCRGATMGDYYAQGNFKQMNNGHVVAVDFDCVKFKVKDIHSSLVI